MKSPDVFDYLDYRDFLRDFYQYLKSTSHFTVRKFTTQLGFKSSSYLSMLLEHKRNLTPKNARGVAHRLGLKMAQVEFFETVVLFCDAKTEGEKEKAHQRLLTFKEFRKIRRMQDEEFQLFREWYIVALYAAFGTSWKKTDPAEIGKIMGIKTEEARDAISVLLKMGVIQKSGSHFIHKDSVLETPPMVGEIMRKFHGQMIEKAKLAAEKLTSEERELGSLTIPLNRFHYEQIKAKLFDLQQAINAAHSDVEDPDKLYQLNYQLFPLFDLK